MKNQNKAMSSLMDEIVSTCYNCHHCEICIIHSEIKNLFRQWLHIFKTDKLDNIHVVISQACEKFIEC